MTAIERLPHMIEQAASRLAKATSAAEVLDVITQAHVAGDAAKSALRFAKAKSAHDTILTTCRKAMADALEIEMRAQCRLADEYDAAQERGEVQKTGGKRGNQFGIIPDKNNASKVTDIGLTSKQVHAARKIRDAEKAKPGLVHMALDEQLEAGKEPTRAHINRVLDGKDKNKSKTPRRESLDQRNERVVTLFDSGMLPRDIAVEVGMHQRTVHQVLEHERVRREAQAEPIIDPATLSLTAQQKIDIAVRQHQRKLDAQFEQRVRDESRRRIEEIALPHWKEQINMAKQLFARRKGLMDKATFNKIRRALHPDSRQSVSDKVLGDAFDTFMSLEKYLLNEQDSPTDLPNVPSTLKEWDERKREATASRKARHTAHTPARRH